MTSETFNKIDNGQDLQKSEIRELLEIADPQLMQQLFDKAYAVKSANVGKVAYFRGLIECSNICAKDCLYCGIRKSNDNVERFLMEQEEIVKEAIWAYENDYASLVIQSGERQDEAFINMIEAVLLEINRKTDNKLGITLSLGEQTRDTYRRWKNAGARRYLLRIETSNPEIYHSLHPEDSLHDYSQRLECLNYLRDTGYQVGTGVMIGLPGQTSDDLANDVLFFKDNDIDMVGMGPYIPHSDTPMGEQIKAYDETKNIQMLELGLRMIAVTRIVMKDINIAASTAMQALKHDGREMALKAGANVIMPNVTDTSYRASYQLYDNKPCIDENSSMCRGCLSKRIEGIGETIGFGEWGDSPHFLKKNKL